MSENNNYLAGPVTEEDIAKVKKETTIKECNLYTLTMDDGKIFEGLFKRPNNASITRHLEAERKALKGKGDVGKMNMRFTLDNMLFPDPPVIHDLSEQYPILCSSIANELLEGQGIVVDAKKKVV